MRCAVRVLRKGEWDEAEEVGAVSLDYDGRQRRRLRMTDDAGAPFLLDLAQVTPMRDGDALALAGGGALRIIAAPEPVAEVTAETPLACIKLAWHLGNRHTPVQILSERHLRIRRDGVLMDMARGLGAAVSEADAPFEPEAGAYGGSADHGHSPGHSHSHSHSHGHAHGH